MRTKRYKKQVRKWNGNELVNETKMSKCRSLVSVKVYEEQDKKDIEKMEDRNIFKLRSASQIMGTETWKRN